jgi:hypothetical protein
MLAPLFCSVLLASAQAAGPDGPAGEVVAEAAGEEITRGRVNLLLTLKEVPKPARAEAWDETVAELADRARMRRFLRGRRATPDAERLDARTAALLERFGEDEATQTETLAALGVTPDDVRTEVALPMAWEVQARRVITPKTLRSHFEENRPRFDGTALTVAHVFQPGDSTADLAAIKRRIDAGELTFLEAALRFSEAPSAADGGVIGPVRAGDGRVPPEVSAAAFSLKKGEVSDPVRSAVGTHLVSVLGVAEPGDLEFEDVALPVRRDLKRKLWNEQLARLR